MSIDITLGNSLRYCQKGNYDEEENVYRSMASDPLIYSGSFSPGRFFFVTMLVNISMLGT